MGIKSAAGNIIIADGINNVLGNEIGAYLISINKSFRFCAYAGAYAAIAGQATGGTWVQRLGGVKA
jgi:hypothetical protein